jgi:hypothetical protein
MKGCSSRTAAVGLSAGFLLKHFWRKSFPSDDNESGIGGVLCNTLNIAAGCKRKVVQTSISLNYRGGHTNH